MIKTKDGYAKLIGTTYSGSVSRVLLSNGGDHVLGNSNGNIPLNNGTVNTNLNADMLDGLHIHTGRNNGVNKIVRTDASGYILAGWINTTSGDIGTGAINKIYCSNDDYIRYKTPANFFPTLANSGNNISITIAGLNRTLTVGYATNADKVDGYHANKIYNAPSFTVNNSNTSNTYILLATITISGTSLGCAEFTTLFQNRECLDSSSFILSGAIRRSSTTSVGATLSYITLHTKTPRNIYLRSDDGVTFRVYILSASGTWTTYYRAIPIVDSGNITYSNIGTTSPISGSVLNITATKGGNVNYANSTGNADTLDNYHANGLLTNLSNSNNGVSITVGGTTKSINNISVNYANSAGSASSATKVIVTQHTANDVNYPLVWSNLANTNTVTENQLHKSWSDLYYNPKNKRLTVGGLVVASSFVKNGSNDTYVLLGGGGHKLISDFAASGHVHNYLALSGGTMTGVIKSTFKSGSLINGVTNAVVKGEYTDYGAILSMPVKDGRVSISSYPSNDNYIYFGYATSALISSNTNSFNKKMYWDAANNKLVADTFLGALLGNATTATTATKLSTSSVGNASLPVYFSNGIPVACTKSSIFSNLSNNGDLLSVTVAGYNRLLTVAFASRADSAVDADYATSSDWAEDALHASSADSATNADYATNADTLDGHHASEFSLSNHIHTLKLESTTGTNSITLAHGGKYKLTAGGNSVIFTLPTDITSITFSGGYISSSGNTLTQANHSITIGGQTETAGYSTCNIINSLSINSLSSSSTTNLAAQITVNGITSALKTITQLHSRFWDVTSNSATSNISPGNYSATITEVQGNASGITGNLPTTSWYHVYTAAGHNTKYATLLALGMTTDGIWYRKYSNSSWGSWLTVLHSGNIGNYYWANIKISASSSTSTTPQFSKVMINTTSTSYQLNVGGDSHTTGWSRAKNGFYCEGNGVYFTHNGTKGEIAVKNNNEFCWGSNSDTLYFNYASPSNGSPVKNYIWNAGSSSTYASHTTGNITLGSNSNNNYQLKRAGYEASWYNGRDRAIIRQTSAANGYSVVISSKTTNGSWEIGNNSDNLYFTYIADTDYNNSNNVVSGQLYFNSSGCVYASHFYENSDIRYKRILKNLLINSNTIANLPLFDFEWIENNTIGTGTSALAVLLILPNLVSGTDKLTLDYGVLGTIAGITACKELVKVNIEIFTLKSELLQLREKVKLLEDKLLKYTQLEN